MDITVSNRKLSSNKYINGETVNYTIAFFFSFFVLLAVKQAVKILFSASSDVACIIGSVLR